MSASSLMWTAVLVGSFCLRNHLPYPLVPFAEPSQYAGVECGAVSATGFKDFISFLHGTRDRLLDEASM